VKAGIVRVLMGGLMLASAVTAQAGGNGGGGETPVLVSLECYAIIRGGSANTTVTLSNSEFFPDQRSVKVGAASLACTPVTVAVGDPPVVLGSFPEAAHLKCYSISGPAVQETVSLQSPLEFSPTDAALSQSRFVCLPSVTP
jgi:hypothetical protein